MAIQDKFRISLKYAGQSKRWYPSIHNSPASYFWNCIELVGSACASMRT